MSARLAISLLLLWAALPLAIASYGGGGAIWKVPSNFSQTFMVGQSVPLSWNAFNETKHDLWLTTWDYQNFPFKSLIYPNIDASTPAVYHWTVSVPTEQLAKTAKYILKFMPSNDTGLLPQNEEERRSSTDWTASPVFQVLSVGTPSTTTSSEQQAFPDGAKAGIAIGAVALVALIAAISWVLWRQYAEERHRSKVSNFCSLVAGSTVSTVSGGPSSQKSTRPSRPKSLPSMAESGTLKGTPVLGYAGGRLPGIHELPGSEPSSATTPGWPIELPTGWEPLPSPPPRTYHY